MPKLSKFIAGLKDLLEANGSPVIEAIPGDPNHCTVHFFFPKDKVNAGNDLYLQGDFHGYGTTAKRARLEHIEGTDLMYRCDIMPKDAIVDYQFVQLPQSIQNKTPTELAGSKLVEPPQEDYFPEILPTDMPEVPPNPESPSDWCSNPATVLPDEYSKHRPGFFVYGEDRMFRVHPDENIAHLPGGPLDWEALLTKEPKDDKHFVLHDVFYSNREGDIQADTHISPEVFIRHGNEHPYDQLTRAIYVFKPKAGPIEDVVLINDGLGYLHSEALEQFEQMVEEGRISPQTGFVFIHTLPGLAKTMEDIEGNEKASLEGMGERTIEYEYGRQAYADFIRDQLFPQLNASGFNIPEDSNHRIMVGSSLSGTFATWLALTSPNLFGTVIAQSPSPSNRHILRDEVINYDASKPRAHILLSCGMFEAPNYAANDNLGYTKQLSSKLQIPYEIGAHGHQFLPWTYALKDTLPRAMSILRTQSMRASVDEVQEDNSSSSSIEIYRKS